MRCHPPLVPTLLLLVLTSHAWCEDSAPESSEADEVPTSAVPGQDPAADTKAAESSGQAQADINQYASDIQAIETRYAPTAGDGMSTVYQVIMKENAAEMADKNRALSSSGTTRFQGRTFDLGVANLTVGGQVSDIDDIDSYPKIPEYVHFITSEKNQLGALDKKMKRAASFLNKHTCGGFDWAAQFGFMFKVSALKEYLTSLGEGVIAAAPMALLGAFSPQLAEIVKHLKLISGMDLSATKADCQAIQASMTSGLQKEMWGDNYSQCLDQHKDDGVAAATKQCQDLVGSVSVPTSDGQKTNPNHADGSGSGWLTDAYSASQDWLTTVYPPNPDAASADALANAANTPGQSPQQASDTGGLAAAQQNITTQHYLNSDKTAAAKDLADTLFGSVKIQGTGALELGKKSYKLFDLKMRAHASLLYSTLIDNLEQHYDLIMSADTDGTALSDSYQDLKICTYRARGAGSSVAPWRDPQVPSDPKLQEDPVKMGQNIDDHTMDAAAYLLRRSQVYKHNAPVWADAENKYHISAFVIALANYECYLHMYRQLREKKEAIDTLKASAGQSGSDFAAMKARATEQFDKAMDDMGKALVQRQNEVLNGLVAINGFVVPRPVHHYDDDPGPGTAPPVNEISLTP
jgi:hypothetical protein